MRAFPKGSTSYAVLLIILFAIAALAVWHTLGFLELHVDREAFPLVAVLIWSLTLGFMLIAGAFGMWAVRFAARQEIRRSIGRVVDAMDYLRDGLLAVDRRQRIQGANPGARSLSGGLAEEGVLLRDAFPFLSESDVAEILKKDEPREVAASQNVGDSLRSLRFRSQPSEGLNLVLISDVTVMEAQRMQHRQAARLQLIGQIARGVAYDFNNLLCAISGHASLLSRLPADSPEAQSSIEAIARGVERGSALAGHLLELVKPSASISFTNIAKDHIENAVNALRDTLHDAWRVEAQIQPLPAVAMTGIQIEQVITNLGLLIADAARRPGVLYVRAAPPGGEFPFKADRTSAGILVISTVETDQIVIPPESADTDAERGVIFSVLQSMLAEAGGGLQTIVAPNGSLACRVILPFASAFEERRIIDLPADLGPYIADWTVLLGRPAAEKKDSLNSRLLELGVNVLYAENIVGILAKADSARRLDAAIVDKRLIIQETPALLKAILKLCPRAGLVVLCDDPAVEAPELASEVVFTAAGMPPNQVILSIIEARSLAMKRSKG